MYENTWARDLEAEVSLSLSLSKNAILHRLHARWEKMQFIL